MFQLQYVATWPSFDLIHWNFFTSWFM